MGTKSEEKPSPLPALTEGSNGLSGGGGGRCVLYSHLLPYHPGKVESRRRGFISIILSLCCIPKLPIPAGIAAARFWFLFLFLVSENTCALCRLLSSRGAGATAGAASRTVQARHRGKSCSNGSVPSKTHITLKAVPEIQNPT